MRRANLCRDYCASVSWWLLLGWLSISPLLSLYLSDSLSLRPHASVWDMLGCCFVAGARAGAASESLSGACLCRKARDWTKPGHLAQSSVKRYQEATELQVSSLRITKLARWG